MNKSKTKQKAENYYNKILRTIEKKHGNDTTYQDQLEKIGQQLFGVRFKGVFPSDKIPMLNDLKPYCILNLDNSKEPGSHWVALVKCKNDAILYDSFGRDDTMIIPNLRFSGNGKIQDTDDDIDQGRFQKNCGQRCLAFLCVYDDLGKESAMMI